VNTRFIVNPRSGRARQAFTAVKDFAARHAATVLVTEHRGHAHELAVQARDAGCDLVVAVGGDGTMNEVASALVGSDTTLGLVPCGSGDGLGRQLGVHGPVAKALRCIESGQRRRIDSGTADGHPFFCVAGLGFEASIAGRFNALQRRGFLRYLSTGWNTWSDARAETYRITCRGIAIDVTAFSVAIANARQYGNNALIAPDARLDDGELNLCAVPRPSILGLPWAAVRLFSGTINEARGVVSLQGTRFAIERPAPGAIHTDGETHDAGRRVEFVVRRASLRVIAP
jgi:YegS/Rv2252/BmrU family lipid kinase